MKNCDVNRIIKKFSVDNNREFWFKRVGRCNPGKCGGACCRFVVVRNNECNSYQDLMLSASDKPLVKVVKDDNNEWYVYDSKCPYMTMDCRCRLHGKKRQPSVCDKFPMTPNDGVFVVLRKFCGYSFKKVKNLRYKEK